MVLVCTVSHVQGFPAKFESAMAGEDRPGHGELFNDIINPLSDFNNYFYCRNVATIRMGVTSVTATFQVDSKRTKFKS